MATRKSAVPLAEKPADLPAELPVDLTITPAERRLVEQANEIMAQLNIRPAAVPQPLATVNITSLEKSAESKPREPQEGFVYFRSARGEDVLFDIRMGEEEFRGYWIDGRERVEWMVPADRADMVRGHHFYRTQRIIDHKF